MIPKLMPTSWRVISCQKGVKNGAGSSSSWVWQHIHQEEVPQTTASSVGPSASFLT